MTPSRHTDSHITDAAKSFASVPESELTCASVRPWLPVFAMEENTDDATPSAVLTHLSQCRPCLKVLIALQAAADMASPLPG
ncbi:MAG: hypothetical protein NXI04_07850 [Planctomycetaceae bacterium]|nr:hypothetical protein [Planctomycetaceae bacterium]